MTGKVFRRAEAKRDHLSPPLKGDVTTTISTAYSAKTLRRNTLRNKNYLAEQADLASAPRFRRAADEACHLLAEMPELGPRRRFKNSRLANARINVPGTNSKVELTASPRVPGVTRAPLMMPSRASRRAGRSRLPPSRHRRAPILQQPEHDRQFQFLVSLQFHRPFRLE